MKSTFISLMLFVISVPAFAEQSFSTSKCLEKYQPKQNSYQSAMPKPEARVLYFSSLCMPESARSEDPRFFNLLQMMEDEEEIPTIQASIKQPVLTPG